MAQVTKEDQHDKIRRSCWDFALHSYAKSYLYSRRTRVIGTRQKIITFLGFFMPMLVGAWILGYGEQWDIFQTIKYVAIAILIVQLGFSLWSLIDGWDDENKYSIESTLDNRNLYNQFIDLANLPPPELLTFKTKYDLIVQNNKGRQSQDEKHPLSEREKRRGMRYALKKLQRPCVVCKIVPNDMSSTNCPVCGNFNLKYIFR